jgi:hypothetical protein
VSWLDRNSQPGEDQASAIDQELKTGIQVIPPMVDIVSTLRLVPDDCRRAEDWRRAAEPMARLTVSAPGDRRTLTMAARTSAV